MGSPRKVFINNFVVFVTMSVESGILLPPNYLINVLLESALARAQALFPVRVCHYLFEATHAHFMLVVDNPNDIPGFIGRFKTESAHFVNRLLGRKKRTIWCEGYDSPVLLGEEDIIEKIRYIYINPSKDGLEDSIEKYPGLSSWDMFNSGHYQKVCPWIHRSDLKRLRRNPKTIREFRELRDELVKNANEAHVLQIEPNAWMDCYNIEEQGIKENINQEIKQYIKEAEVEIKRTRLIEGKTVIGKNKLMLQNIDLTYEPNRSGRRSWCICKDRIMKSKFMQFVRDLIEEGKEVLKRWREGDFRPSYPEGLFPPSMPKLAELWPSVLLEAIS